jgi:SAM-dependent methyltransferase
MGPSENMVQVSNQRNYFAPSVLRGYTTYNLMRAEAMVLLKYQPCFAHKKILDIGIGCGRTTIYLEPLAEKYVGIDFSPTFVDFVNTAMPSVDARLCDMRDLGEFNAESFDFVLASFNVIDFVTHQDRLKTLVEVRRVLKPGGIFVFSSHNRAWELTGSRPHLELNRDPVRQARIILRWGRRLINYLKWKRHWVFAEDHAIVGDVGNDFSTLHYYVDQQASRRQLEECGFSILEVCDIDGRPLDEEDVDAKSPFLTYVVKKR